MGTLETPLRRLLPEPGTTTVGEIVAGFDPAAAAPADRPYLYTNFALTIDGHATIEGRSGAIGSDADTAMLVGLRMRADAVMIGAGTLRAEGYGQIIRDPEKMPPVNVSMLDGQLAWRQHDGGHTDGPNWKYFLPWADTQLARSRR